MERVHVALGERSYDVHIENEALDRASQWLAPFARDGRLVVVTDENVWAAQGERLVRGLGEIAAAPIVIPAGEESKNWATLSGLVDRLIELGVERGDHIVAFGGGMVGDLAGFAAAIVKRGCGFVQIPTSLLAQVDSSVGGKTGINTEAGKNMAGAFHQPSFVLIDPSCLATVDPRQIRSGYAEIAKYALIEDAALFEWLEAHGAKMIAGEPEALRHGIAAAVAGKARIVAEDERETGDRRILLNLGHTFGHALEAETGFSDRLLHGEAVAAGIGLAFDFSVRRGLCAPGDAARAKAHLAAIGLPTGLAEAGVTASGEQLAEHMRHDKKGSGGRIPFILERGIGQAFVAGDVAIEEVAAFLDQPG
ncbi:MAG: 3-dehydroquinate synthase [Sphingosinicella sp.]|nr:3-dehydroquinate synthase [Sphingosinicella sp.]